MPGKTKDRLIIDTNIWISFLLSKNYSKIDLFLANNNIVLLFSQELLDEFIEVAQRPKFKRYFSNVDLQELLTEIQTKAEFIKVASDVDLCRDPKDNFLLSLLDGSATHLLTGDKDLLVLEKIGQTRILSLFEYLHS